MMPLTQIIQNSSYVKQELSLTFRLFIIKKIMIYVTFFLV